MSYISTFKTYAFIYLVGGITFLPLTLLCIFFLLPEKKKFSDDGKSSIFDKDIKVGEYMDSVHRPEKSGFIMIMSKFNKNVLSDKQHASTGLESLAVDSSTYSKLKSNNKFFCQLKNNSIVLYSNDVDAVETVKAHEEKSQNFDLITSDLTLKDTKKIIALKDCYVTLWPPNLSEGSLFTKKTSILIIKKGLYDCTTKTFKLATKIEHFINNNVFFLQFDNNFDKEDWFFTILQSQRYFQSKDNISKIDSSKTGYVDGLGHFFDIPPPTFHFQTADVTKLIALNNADNNHINCKWFNLIISRIFMSFKANNKIENVIKEKIKDKLSKVNVSFLDDFVINDLKLGNIPPLLSNPKVIKMDLEGDLEVHFDIVFDSHFTLNISTVMNLLNKNYPIELKLDIKKVKGTIMIIFKKPPSNRIWYTFKSIPLLEMEIDPVVVNKSLSYNKILKPLKSKILDAFKDALVYPNFEDINYYKMLPEHENNFYKGGLWDFAGFENIFSNNYEPDDDSVSDYELKDDKVSEDLISDNVNNENDEGSIEKGSALSSGVLASNMENEQVKNGLKERRPFKNFLVKTNSIDNDSLVNTNHEVDLDNDEVYSSNSNDSSGTKKVSTKFNTFYQKAKKSASTMIGNMKADSENNLSDEVTQETTENQDDIEKPTDQIPKLPRRRPLPPIPNEILTKSINYNVPLDSLDMKKQTDLPVDLEQSEKNSNILHHEVKIKQENQDFNNLDEQD
ncbi:uncharacterized protein HGUI_01508 [Hanseniaspora guilliermondii]|uniref:SMP-LTD domain-containing protein n=1 Tax=Hanseniaspora guilliermondii TaxID=56406 RepID=A0A1L0B0I5_9ASCO|nr:uncharacterized protein HGUI_01508 [Hanseniaspora guilliermondii]